MWDKSKITVHKYKEFSLWVCSCLSFFVWSLHMCGPVRFPSMLFSHCNVTPEYKVTLWSLGLWGHLYTTVPGGKVHTHVGLLQLCAVYGWLCVCVFCVRGVSLYMNCHANDTTRHSRYHPPCNDISLLFSSGCPMKCSSFTFPRKQNPPKIIFSLAVNEQECQTRSWKSKTILLECMCVCVCMCAQQRELVA